MAQEPLPSIGLRGVMANYRIIIVDDHPLFRDALGQMLSASFEHLSIDQAPSFDALSQVLARDANADLILLDLNMPGVHGFSGLLYLRAQHPGIPVVMVSAAEDPVTIRRCLDFGASGYIPKSQPAGQIREALKTVMGGGVWTPPGLELPNLTNDATHNVAARIATLTPQQLRVLMMLGEGLLNKQIAHNLGVSEATVKAHVSAILQKLRVDSRTQAVIAVGRIESGDWQKLGD